MSKVEAKGVDGPITVEAGQIVHAGAIGETITGTDGWSFSVGSTALMDVMRERTRQINEEGWTPAHDDHHAKGEMATAALCYIRWGGTPYFPAEWPWSAEWWKPTERRRDLVKAAALIVAEIERLDRAELRAVQAGGTK